MSVARFGEHVHAQRGRRHRPRRRGVRRPVRLLAQPHGDGARRVHQRADRRAAEGGWVPYRDYIGSNLEIMDVATGERTVVSRRPISVQAPNWTPDGKALIYNSEGKLYRFDLARRSATQIDTGFATSNNNDHVLSFDGKMLGISHQPPRTTAIGRLHAAGDRRHAEARSPRTRRRIFTAGRPTASCSSTPACATANSTSTGFPSAGGRGDAADDDDGRRRRARVLARRAVDLLQLDRAAAGCRSGG